MSKEFDRLRAGELLQNERRRELGEDHEVRAHFRSMLRDARAAALADAEGADVVIFAIEALGRYLLGKEQPLDQTGSALLGWVLEVLGDKRGEELDRRLFLLKNGRNQRMHKGFAARNLAADAVRVATMLEEALLMDWKKLTAADVMSRGPLVAQPWWTFSMVRDALIENAYSHLPIYWKGKWKTISDLKVAKLAQKARQQNQTVDLRCVPINTRPSDNPDFGVLVEDLVAEVTVVIPSEKSIALDLVGGCVLVVRKLPSCPNDLLGIITPSDIM